MDVVFAPLKARHIVLAGHRPGFQPSNSNRIRSWGDAWALTPGWYRPKEGLPELAPHRGLRRSSQELPKHLKSQECREQQKGGCSASRFLLLDRTFTLVTSAKREYPLFTSVQCVTQKGSYSPGPRCVRGGRWQGIPQGLEHFPSRYTA